MSLSSVVIETLNEKAPVKDMSDRILNAFAALYKTYLPEGVTPEGATAEQKEECHTQAIKKFHLDIVQAHEIDVARKAAADAAETKVKAEIYFGR